MALALVLEEYLGEAGYEITLCHNGREALALLGERTFDLILLDIMLPGVNGLDILDRAGGDPYRTLVILMTGFSGIEDALHAVERGAYDFVSKPFQLPEIRVRIDNAARYQVLLRQHYGSADEMLGGRDGVKHTAVQISGDAAARVYSARERV